MKKQYTTIKPKTAERSPERKKSEQHNYASSLHTHISNPVESKN